MACACEVIRPPKDLPPAISANVGAAARGLRNGCTHGRVTDRRRIGAPRAALHVRELEAQSRDTPSGELRGDRHHGRMIHACARAVCEHKASRGGGWKLKQRGDAASLVDLEGQPLCTACAH